MEIFKIFSLQKCEAKIQKSHPGECRCVGHVPRAWWAAPGGVCNERGLGGGRGAVRREDENWARGAPERQGGGGAKDEKHLLW